MQTLEYMEVAVGKKEHAAARLNVVPNLEKAGLVSALIKSRIGLLEQSKENPNIDAISLAFCIERDLKYFQKEFRIKYFQFTKLLDRFKDPNELIETINQLNEKIERR